MIRSIKLKNYVNFKELDLEFGNGVNVILGDNCVGKSDVVSALTLSPDALETGAVVELEQDEKDNFLTLNYKCECELIKNKDTKKDVKFQEVLEELKLVMKHILGVKPDAVISAQKIIQAEKSIATEKLLKIYRTLINYCSEDKLVIIWEEVDCGFSPTHFPYLASLLNMFAKNGIQVFITSQSNTFMNYAMKECAGNVSFFYLHKDADENIACETSTEYAELQHNHLRDANLHMTEYCGLKD